MSDTPRASEEERLDEEACGICGRSRDAHHGIKEFCDESGWIDWSGCGHGKRFTQYHDDGSIIGEQA